MLDFGGQGGDPSRGVNMHTRTAASVRKMYANRGVWEYRHARSRGGGWR
jgi:hypothetical protein